MTQVEALIQRNLRHVRERNYTTDYLYKAYVTQTKKRIVSRSRREWDERTNEMVFGERSEA